MTSSTVAAPHDTELFYFGCENFPLLGCFHSAANPVDRGVAAIVCHPMGHEYVESHRALRQLAVRLAGRGIPVLRFDHRGCGDSAGGTEDWSLSRWLDDIEEAEKELRRRSAADRILMLGLRLGASLGVLAAARRTQTAALALWDPVIEGRQYLEELRALHRARATGDGRQDARGQLEALGFRLNRGLHDELANLDLLTVRLPDLERALIIETKERASEACIALAEHLERQGVHTQRRHIPVPGFWEGDMDKLLVPAAVIDALSGWASDA